MNQRMDQDLLISFVAEVRGCATAIRARVEQARGKDPADELLAEVRRDAHMLKGASSMAGFAGLSHTGYLIEMTVDALREGKLGWDAEVFSILEKGAAVAVQILDGLTAGRVDERAPVATLIQMHRRLLRLPESGDAAEIDAILGPAVEAPEEEILGEVTPAEIVQIFLQEVEDLMRQIGEGLNRLSHQPADRKLLLDVRRPVHTLKGAAASMGFAECGKLAHRMEDVLDAINSGAIEYSAECSNLLYACFDALAEAAAEPDDRSRPRKALAEIETRFGGILATVAAHPKIKPESLPKPVEAAVEVPADMPADMPAELEDAFRAEAEEQLRRVAESLDQFEREPQNRDLLLDVRRALHTLKGCSNMIGFRVMATLSHKLEDLIDKCHSNACTWSEAPRSLLMEGTDLLSDLAGGPKQDRQDRVHAIESRIAALIGEPSPVPATESGPAPVKPLPAIDKPSELVVPARPDARDASVAASLEPEKLGKSKSGQYVRVPIEKLDELVRLVGELVVNRSTLEQWRNGYTHTVEELGLSNDRLERVSNRIDMEYEVTALGSGLGQLAMRAVVVNSPTDARQEFDDLEFDRYTDFHLFSRDLSEISSDIGSASSDLRQRVADFDGRVHRLGRLISEMQDKLMRLRMVPLSTLAHRMQRTVRVAAEKRGKLATLSIHGADVELDRMVLEEMVGPIEHLLRNAVDHGLESPAYRKMGGKPERGVVSVRGSYQGTHVVIEVSDDGGGFQVEKIREAAVRLGFVDEREAAELQPEQLYPFIFEPGFSTAAEVSEISGRGVGMDIVKNAVTRLKGDIAMKSRAGEGTVFTIRLPMTLAVTRVLMLRSHGQTFAIPLALIHQILSVDPKQVEVLGDKPVLRFQRRALPLVRLSELLRGGRPQEHTYASEIPVVILQLGDQQIALTADALLEAREVVVKTLGDVLQRVKGITGATLTGDGKVVLILNPGELYGAVASPQTAPAIARRRHVNTRALEVLVVDDSVSIRRMLGNLVTREGWKAIAAKDGVDALEILQRAPRKPDAILLDIEMPRMDGYELTATLRGQEAFRHIPIVILTSRAGDKHRRKAFDLGASDYLVKPYEDEVLLETIRKVVRETKKETPVP